MPVNSAQTRQLNSCGETTNWEKTEKATRPRQTDQKKGRHLGTSGPLTPLSQATPLGSAPLCTAATHWLWGPIARPRRHYGLAVRRRHLGSCRAVQLPRAPNYGSRELIGMLAWMNSGYSQLLHSKDCLQDSFPIHLATQKLKHIQRAKNKKRRPRDTRTPHVPDQTNQTIFTNIIHIFSPSSPLQC